jgi:hypothetical protein
MRMSKIFTLSKLLNFFSPTLKAEEQFIHN